VSEDAPTVRELLQKTRAWWEGLGLPSARLDAELLLGRALGLDRLQLMIAWDRPVGAEELDRFRALAKRRARREPVAYILGEREFWGRRFAVDARVLIPRPDTETLVQVALDRLDGVSVPEGDVVYEAEVAPPRGDGDPVFVPDPSERGARVDFALERPAPLGAAEGAASEGAGPLAAADDVPEAAIESQRGVESTPQAPPRTVLDYGTGSGAIAVTLAAERPGLRVIAVDISGDALTVARENAADHGVADRVGFVLSDGFERVPARFLGALDGVVANPPYLDPRDRETIQPDVRLHEPATALWSDDPLAHYRLIAAAARRFLRPGGFVAVEVGAGQANAVRGFFAAAGFGPVRSRRDLAGIERVVYGLLGVNTSG
jgi:release factor glutamine methyltransferase